jgi:hypothetical protein
MKMNLFEEFKQTREAFKGVAEKSLLILFLSLVAISESEAQTKNSGPLAPGIPASELPGQTKTDTILHRINAKVKVNKVPDGEVSGYRLGRAVDVPEEVREAPTGGNAPHIHQREDESDRTDINDALRSWNKKKNETKHAPPYKIPDEVLYEIKKNKKQRLGEIEKYFGKGNGPDNTMLNPSNADVVIDP